MVKRVRGVRAAFAAKPAVPGPAAFPIGGNYYPITSAIYVRDAARRQQLSLITDRGQGAHVSNVLSGAELPSTYVAEGCRAEVFLRLVCHHMSTLSQKLSAGG